MVRKVSRLKYRTRAVCTLPSVLANELDSQRRQAQVVLDKGARQESILAVVIGSACSWESSALEIQSIKLCLASAVEPREMRGKAMPPENAWSDNLEVTLIDAGMCMG